jgi:hypothetical protein
MLYSALLRSLRRTPVRPQTPHRGNKPKRFSQDDVYARSCCGRDTWLFPMLSALIPYHLDLEPDYPKRRQLEGFWGGI